ncbi:DUF349 domain-containing protein [Thalassotalea castellviae]|uniref:DUF349 domain-containing protein n=1 Tax=Thalassotalea castellviae TaxID=3075612 RepID=A0ABU2ZVT2_9GAMM|nr:DUF349 domain-containing protein [Thalassotalea sp. W431]MDT0602051.1 DUF349 domain-containing protein [Thalassotalea sp. W431]
MIFSRFRNKSTWQSKDSNTRISAVNNDLDISNVEQKDILLSLLAKDPNELVRRAVLIKFNDFSLWQQTSENNDDINVRDYARKEVVAIILNQRSLKLSKDEKLAYLNEQPTLAFLETWLKEESDPQIVIAIYQKLAKPQLALTVFKHHNHIEIQQYLVEQATSIDNLEKLLKKSTIAEITESIKAKIIAIKIEQEKPIKIAKRAQLILAKLLALKDVSDYQTVLEKQASLTKEWGDLTTDFTCLEESQQLTFTTKYQDINDQLEKIFAVKAELFAQQKIADALEKEKQLLTKQFAEHIQKYEQSLSDAIFNSIQIDEDEFIQQLTQLQATIDTSVLAAKEKHTFIKQVEVIKNKLSKLPEIAESLTQATHLISKMSQHAVPENLTQLREQEASYQAWLENWQLISEKSNGSLPDSIVQSYQVIVNQWDIALKPLHQQQKQNFHQVQRKLNDFNRLISQGKFNPCFGLFKKIKSSYELLSGQQQHRLEREFTAAQEKINELSDWEHYVSTPKKQALLEQINLLVNVPLDNPIEQASKVKAFRQQWNALGHAEDDVEQELNDKFNHACEQAFAPCRLFYAEQDKIRANHLTNRLTILEEVATFTANFDEENVNWKSIDAKINQLKQKWRDAGEVDREKYKTLNEEFNTLLKPIKLAIHQHHLNNKDEKLSLIKQAEKVLAEENIQVAVDHVKKLQTKWRDIGYSGPKDENKLWQQFRTINDQVFARRNEAQNKEKEQAIQMSNDFMQSLVEIEQKVSTDNSSKILKACLSDLKQLKDKVAQQAVPLKAVQQKIETLQVSFQKTLTQLKQQERVINWQRVFSILTESIDSTIATDSNDFNALPMSWQKKLANLTSESCDPNDRLAKTIALEIMAKVESPDEDKQQRLAIQVELMQSHMSSGETFNLEEQFFEWLNLGQLSSEDKPLLARVHKIFIET